MTWIRGPAWDGLWILSGLPIGLVLVSLTSHPAAMWMFFSLAVLLETGHALSPIVLAWSHSRFRRIMVERKAKYILLPMSIFIGSVAIGAATSLGVTSYQPGPHRMSELTGLTNPFPMLVWVYMIWNAYHFGMQNFGVLSIYRRTREEQEARGNGAA